MPSNTTASPSFEEKRTWIHLATAVGVYLAYLAVILVRARGTPLADVAYQGPLLVASGVAIAITVVANLASALISPEGARRDVRDVDINLRGEVVGYAVFGFGAVVPLGLAMAEVDPFWIANAIYLAYHLAAIASAAVRIRAYRRGF